ncbi:glycosyltransferase family 2 protein [Adhaeribacter soli]|uniref:Glycosyltransferase family 2 protein n=1 Tax=Adhaeribacter soli TaxID=2607655 RepID=A0A5N1J760_9BACT|nr:glycosyltransferase [Adhaeribacter soli]KAA9345802.1 glycosyltransferase family 2 protein [Adhaeribacter soli]
MVSELSILIPVYNYDVTELALSLLKQCRQVTSNFEICLYDDGSEEKFRKKHRPLNSYDEIRYLELRYNIGRASIRNRLAADAVYKNLLFLDNDSALPDEEFISRYWNNPEKADVLIGGTIYEAEQPSDLFMLRWRYGKAREEKTAAVRNKQPYRSLTLNNMLIRKDVYETHPLYTGLEGYGHEDTRFGWELQKAGVSVKHIDNPVIHMGLEPGVDFIKKTKQAVKNLHKLYLEMGDLPDSSLLKAYRMLARAKARKAFLLAFRPFKATVLTNLKSDDPNLTYFDLYKLYLFTKQALSHSK